MNIAGQDVICILKNRLGLVSKDDFGLRTAGADQITVIFHVVDAGKLVLVHAEQFTVFFQGENVTVGVYAGGVDFVQADQLVTNLVGGIAQHQDNLLCSHSDTTQTNSKSVTGKDGEDYTDGAASQLGLNVIGDILNRCVVTLGTCHDGFRHGNDVAIFKGKAFRFRGLKDTVSDDGRQIVSFADDRATDTA